MEGRSEIEEISSHLTPVALLLSRDPKLHEGTFEWLITQNSPRTRKNYLTVLKEFAAWIASKNLTLEELRAIHIAAYKDYLSKRPKLNSENLPLGPAQRILHQRAVKSLLGFLEVRGLLDRNAAASVKVPSDPYQSGHGSTPALNRRELALFFGGFPGPEKAQKLHDLRDHALVATMYLCWNRLEALATLLVRDYYQEGERWWLRFLDKGGQIVIKEVHPELRAILDRYIEAAGISDDTDGPLFRSGRGRSEDLSRHRILPRNIRDMVRRRGEAVGLRGLHPQMIRVSGYTEFREQGGTEEEGQRRFAHRSRAITRRYDRSEVRHEELRRGLSELTLKFAREDEKDGRNEN